MAFALITDIHANLAALTVVLEDIARRGINEVHCLGDVVDYGARPLECLELVNKACGHNRILGNHDLAVIGIGRDQQVGSRWHAMTDWTANKLGEAGIKALMNGDRMSYNFQSSGHSVALAHAVPAAILENRREKSLPYIYSGSKSHPETINMRMILSGMEYQHVDIAAYGHTHMAYVYNKPNLAQRAAQKVRGKNASTLVTHTRAIAPGTHEYCVAMPWRSQTIVNVPSVGQPRDNDPRTGYVFIDDKGVHMVRLDYDVNRTLHEMAKSGIPIDAQAYRMLQNFVSYGDVLPTKTQTHLKSPLPETRV